MAASQPNRPAADPQDPAATERQPNDPEIQRYVQEHSRLLSGDARFRRTGLNTSDR